MSTDTDNLYVSLYNPDGEGDILETFDVFPGDLDFLAAFGEFTFDDSQRCFESDEAMMHWLNSPHAAFDGQTPSQMLKQPVGLARVLTVLLSRPMG